MPRIKKITNNDVLLNSPEMIDYRLRQEEQLINLKILHKMDRESCAKKQNRFRRTVLAVYNIVSQKLYKIKASSVEVYFRDSWSISRAQVYRFLDCAEVLKQLEDFAEQPCKERLCRSLKRLAHNREDIRILWISVLKHVTNNNQTVTSTVISSVWNELLKNRIVSTKKEVDNKKGGFKTRNSFRTYQNKNAEQLLDTKGQIKKDTNPQDRFMDKSSATYDNQSKTEWSSHNSHQGSPSARPVKKDARTQAIDFTNSKDPLQELMKEGQNDIISDILSKWSGKSLCNINNLYHMNPREHQGSSKPSYEQELHKDSSYWKYIAQNANNGLRPSNQIYQLHPQEDGFEPQRDIQNFRTGKFQTHPEEHLVGNHLNSCKSYPFVTDSEYEQKIQDFMWRLQVQDENDVNIFPDNKPDLNQMCLFQEDIEYCHQYAPEIDDCSAQQAVLRYPSQGNMKFCDVYSSPSMNVPVPKSNPTLDHLVDNSAPWGSEQEYPVQRKQYMHIIHPKQDNEVFEHVKLQQNNSPAIFKQNQQELTPKENNGEATESSNQEEFWDQLSCNRARTSMDQCGRTSFSEFYPNDPLLYCNN